MADLSVILFDDAIARAWMPFTLTRPAGELRFGALTLRERVERVLGTRCAGHLTAQRLEGFDEPGAPPVLDAAALPCDRDLLLLSSRVVPAWQGPPAIDRSRPAPILVQDTVCGWYLPAGTEPPAPDALLEPAASPAPRDGAGVRLEGMLLSKVWELIARNPEQVAHDVDALFPDAPKPAVPEGVHVFGGHRLIIGEGASVEPGAVLDLRAGPIWLNEGSSVSAFTRLVGPAYIGPGTTVLGGAVSAVSVGPKCRIRGEVEESVVLGYTNKAHDGFLGHSYVGAWVNLGALTTNSDLKNNYGPVRIWTPDGEQDTGQLKLGCLLGDHVKTSIGTLLNTGTVVGAGANIFGPGVPPKYIPPFSWGTGAEAAVYELERFLAMAETVMARRGVALTAKQRALLSAAWHESRNR